ncbi:MAG: hypothetical protein CML46_22235 [Rhodobacteraceae bacterium]|nr:hypothetical protein [Paracoccaceae bacterium]MBR29626.1 hypothetical protein [Paracoccaceae bacterium]
MPHASPRPSSRPARPGHRRALVPSGARPARGPRFRGGVFVAGALALLGACGAEGQGGGPPPLRPETVLGCGQEIAGATPRGLADRGVALVFVEATAGRGAEASPRPVTLELEEIDTGERVRLGCSRTEAGRTVAYGLAPSGRWRLSAVAPLAGEPGVAASLRTAEAGAEDELRLGAGEAMHLGRAAWTLPAGSGPAMLRADMPDRAAREDAQRIAPGMAPALLLRELLGSG